MQEVLKVECQGAGLVALEEFDEFQGELKHMTEESFQKLRKNLLGLGFSSPFHLWKSPIDNRWKTIDGHQRRRGILRMRDKEGVECPAQFPYVVVEASTEKIAKKKILALIGQYGDVDRKGLFDFMADNDIPLQYVEQTFRIPDVDMPAFREEFFGRDDTEGTGGGEGTGSGTGAGPEDPPDPTPLRPARCKPGELWKLGEHRLFCGDASKLNDVLELLGGDKIDLIFTDPPYNLAEKTTGLASAAPTNKQNAKLMGAAWDVGFKPDAAAAVMLQVLAPDASVYVCTSHFLFEQWMSLLSASLDFTNFCIWSKPNPFPSLAKRHWAWSSELVCYGTKGKHAFNYPEAGNALSVWTLPVGEGGLHPTQKPVAVSEHAIKHSSAPGARVADFFLGSGSTLIACEKTGRRCFGMEINPAYVDVVLNRWEQWTGKQASRI